MKKSFSKLNIILTLTLLAVFIGFTLIVSLADRQPVGPNGSTVGLGSLNKYTFDLLGESDLWKTVTSYIGYAAIALAAVFVLWTAASAIAKKSIRRVDHRLLAMLLLYAALGVAYATFEIITVNYRPILVDGALKASYPSSHVLLTVTILSTAALAIREMMPDKKALNVIFDTVSSLMIVFMAYGRLSAGVHWLTDIIGGILLALTLACFYFTVIKFIDERKARSSDESPTA